MASKNEKRAAELGMTLKQYKQSDEYKSKKSGGGDSVSDLVKAVLKATPAQQPVTENIADFEKYYAGLEEQDFATAEALYTPYFEKEIAMELEDLNAWSEAENVSYDRSLRRARFALAAQGGAIGTERDETEGEITQDHNARVQNQVRTTERSVGTANVQKAGFQSAGMEQKGTMVDKMQAAIQEGQLYFKNLAAQKYFGNQKTYFSSPTNYSLSGEKL